MEDTEAKIIPGISMSVLILMSTLFLGGVVLVIGYIVSRLSQSNKSSDSTKNVTESDKVKFEESRDSTSGSIGAAGGTNKRAKNKKRRETQQEFTHSWVVGALKGHTGPVLDMNFSSNGKFIASCAEDCGLRPEEEVLDPGETECYKNRVEMSASTKAARSKSKITNAQQSHPSPSNMTSPAMPTSTMPPPSAKEDRTILSRRQRKNRTRNPRDQRREQDDEQRIQEEYDEEQRDSNGSVAVQMTFDGGREPDDDPRMINNEHGNAMVMENNTGVMMGNGAMMMMMMVGAGYGYVDSRNCDFLSNERRQLCQFSDATLSSILRNYTLTGEGLAHLGYPVECAYYPGYTVFINSPHPTGHRVPRYHRLDANAQEFVPSSRQRWTAAESEGDSGNSSGSSVDNSDFEQEVTSSDSSDIGEYSSSSTESNFFDHNYYQRVTRRNSNVEYYSTIELMAIERKCARCHKSFYVNREDGEYLYEEKCVHHWGKLRSGLGGAHCDLWECCRSRETSRGCTTADFHVWTGAVPGYNGPFDDYVRTKLAQTVPQDGNYGVYGIDCEMCFTRRGLELVKVTVVDMDGRVVYDTLVRPDVEIIDYNTRFSGISAHDLENVTKRLIDVQQDLLSFIFAETILIGHGMENDLRALKLLHTTVIDTCVAFPHFLGYPYRSSLKTLARTVLRRDIQVSEHDSVEDSRIVVDLMLRRVKHDYVDNHS